MGKIKLILLVIILVIAGLIIVTLVLNPTKNSAPLKNIEIAKEIYGFSATIQKINGDTLTLESIIPLIDLTQEPIKTTVKAFVNDDTRIIKLKFPDETQNELIPEETIIELKDLRAGDKITVSSATNASDSIKNNEKFLLTDIFLIEK
jgi:hypothetical protein